MRNAGGQGSGLSGMSHAIFSKDSLACSSAEGRSLLQAPSRNPKPVNPKP